MILHIEGMSRAEAMTEKQKHIVIQKNKICNFGRARYIYENAVAGEQGYTLSRSFKNSVQHQLPTTYNERAYMRFIEQWGTVCTNRMFEAGYGMSTCSVSILMTSFHNTAHHYSS